MEVILPMHFYIFSQKLFFLFCVITTDVFYPAKTYKNRLCISPKTHKACNEKYKPYILKYKALISKYMPYIFYLSERLKNNDLPKRSKSMSKRKEKAGDKRFHRSNLPPALISLYSYLNRWLSYQNLCKGQEP